MFGNVKMIEYITKIPLWSDKYAKRSWRFLEKKKYEHVKRMDAEGNIFWHELHVAV